MDKCCTSDQTPRLQRRTNGLQLPLNYQQVIGWVVFAITALINLVILIEIQFKELKIISLITYIILYVFHIGSHATALLTDPSEKELRKLKVNNVPEFDRSVHAHVIENGRCHLCNIYTSSRNTKHCSLCNKCVDRFDHHCKWLNNCIGQRNYAAFITCVTTALLISLFTTSLCLTDIVLFLAHPEHLSSTAQYFINCSSVDTTVLSKYCKDSITFLTFLIIFAISALAIACALLHLCCFHVYISMLGVSTYEYIVKSGTSKTSQPRCNSNNRNCCTVNVTRRIYIIRNKPDKNTRRYRQSDGSVENELDDKANTSNTQTGQSHPHTNNETNVANLISVLISNELGRAKNMFLYDKNKIHPQNKNTSS